MKQKLLLFASAFFVLFAVAACHSDDDINEDYYGVIYTAQVLAYSPAEGVGLSSILTADSVGYYKYKFLKGCQMQFRPRNRSVVPAEGDTIQFRVLETYQCEEYHVFLYTYGYAFIELISVKPK